MRVNVIGREVYDDGDVLLAQCANSDCAEYIAASLELMQWVCRGFKEKQALCIRVEGGEVEIGLTFAPGGFVVQGRAKTIDAAVRAALLDAGGRE